MRFSSKGTMQPDRTGELSALLERRILILDGAMGTTIQGYKLSEADFRTRLIAKLKPMLDTAVTNKQLTSTQAQAIIQRLQTGPIPYWKAPVKHSKTTSPASPKPA